MAFKGPQGMSLSGNDAAAAAAITSASIATVVVAADKTKIYK